MKQDFELNDRFCDASDIEKAYRDIVIPDEVADVFSTLFDVYVKSKYPTRSEDSLETELEDSDFADGKLRKILSVYQIILYIVNNGRKRTPFHAELRSNIQCL